MRCVRITLTALGGFGALHFKNKRFLQNVSDDDGAPNNNNENNNNNNNNINSDDNDNNYNSDRTQRK